MAQIDLHYVDELIEVRKQQHGGGQGAPPIQGGYRVGQSINRSCIVMLSALLQAYVEEVFQDAAKRAFPSLANDPNAFDAYWTQMKRSWGNPSDANIKHLFLKLGIPNVFTGLSWQRAPTASVTRMLDRVNQIRNKIAHGMPLTVDGNPYSLRLADVITFRNMTSSFAARFEDHVRTFIQ